MATRVKNITFSLPIEIIEKFREYAKCNYIPSMNSGAKEALEASKDRIFMQDLEESMCSFESSDKEMEMKQDW